MKKQIVEDERVLAQKRKIGNDIYHLLTYGLLVAILIQEYIFNAPFSQYAVETVLFVASVFYYLICNLKIGNSLFPSSRYGHKKILVTSLVCGLIILVINTVLNYAKFEQVFFSEDIGDNVLVSFITFISGAFATFIVLELLYLVNKKKQERIESLFSDEEDIKG